MGEEWEEEVSKIEQFDLSTFMYIKELSDQLFRRYHFIHTELYALCQIDEELRELNQARLLQRKEQTKMLTLALIESEGYEPLDEASLEFLADSIWMYAIFWQPYQELIHPKDDSSFSMANVELLLSKFLIKKEES